MSIVYVIHCERDRELVEKELLPSLPCNGFDRWISSEDMRVSHAPSAMNAQVLAGCRVILVVVSRAASQVPEVRDEAAGALACKTPVIVVLAGRIEDGDRARFPPGLWSLPRVDFAASVSAAQGELAELLPPAEPVAEASELEGMARLIEWKETIFSAALAETVERHDHNRAQVLIDTLARHAMHRTNPYPPKPANADLTVLRSSRQFKLMRRYAEAVLASGTTDAKVRRQYGQSLIEQKEFARALEVLSFIVQDSAAPNGEVEEAQGLIGRLYKQQYLDDPKAPGSPRLLLQAIDAYGSVYDKDPSKLWHGVNTASCILRASRDGVKGADPERARQIARAVLENIEQLASAGKLDIWDYATRVEAWLALDRYDEAEEFLDLYLYHPAMHAFEVSSTYRQFDELLELGQSRPGRPILERLRQTVERHRAGGVSGQPAVRFESMESVTGGKQLLPLLIRVADPDWQPMGVVDLVLEARLGTIVSAQGTSASVGELLKDTEVISVNQSRPASTAECDRSLPFIHVAANYPASAGTYEERGDGALVATIDNGIDVLHEAFLDAQGRSRIIGIWDQRDLTGPPPAGFSLGTYHDSAAIAGYVKNKSVPAGLGRNKDGHGTHVASIAAGRAVGDFAGGVAPEAKLLIVISASQEPTGYSKSHVQALVFISQLAEKLGLPVVINVSQGMNAGAHDGKSDLEVAFDEFSQGGKKPGRVIVKSAGNERAKGGHAKVTLGQNGGEDLSWTRDSAGLGSERLELWWSAADELAFRLRHPAGIWTPWVSQSGPKEVGDLAGVPFEMQLTKRHTDNGDSQLIIEIGKGVPAIPSGSWQLQIQSGKVPEGGEIHAWIERGAGAPSSFSNHTDEEMTLSVPGTAQSVITVGAVDASIPIKVGSFSSYGPTRDGRQKPEVAAPGVNVRAARGGTDSEVRPDCGTSMAAPHVAGAIALLLSRMAKTQVQIPTASQIASALRQKTSDYDGRWRRDRGFGVVDVAALLAAF